MTINVSMLYSNRPGGPFDLRYDVEKHMPQAAEV